jgi:hypothetical protein
MPRAAETRLGQAANADQTLNRRMIARVRFSQYES